MYTSKQQSKPKKDWPKRLYNESFPTSTNNGTKDRTTKEAAKKT